MVHTKVSRVHDTVSMLVSLTFKIHTPIINYLAIDTCTGRALGGPATAHRPNTNVSPTHLLLQIHCHQGEALARFSNDHKTSQISTSPLLGRTNQFLRLVWIHAAINRKLIQASHALSSLTCANVIRLFIIIMYSIYGVLQQTKLLFNLNVILHGVLH